MIIKFLSEYLKYIGNQAGNERNKSILQLLPLDRNAKYLDVGCGDGTLTLKRAKKIGTKKIYGCDLVDDYISEAKKKNIFIKKADLNNKLPFKDTEFDIITATQVIEHLSNVDMFASEIYRILKPEGIAIISTENLAAWHNIFALLLGLQPSTGPWISKRFSVGFHPLNNEYTDKEIPDSLIESNPHTRVMTYCSMKKLFQLYNFDIIKECMIGYYPFPPALAKILAGIDRWHCVNIILKLQKK
ncbi:MAG: class I SAM-dependent methyltransferase [Candidatus Levybacteria bacterium]|nr:class I SAM-dependent methyltransferase [Candidatus Levybacteria bacterium]